MARRRSVCVVLCICVVLSLAFALQLAAQEKQVKGKDIQYSGRITVVNKSVSTITIQGKTGVMEIAYDSKTKYTKNNKPGSSDEVKQGVRVICLVSSAEKGRLLATRIDVRTGK